MWVNYESGESWIRSACHKKQNKKKNTHTLFVCILTVWIDTHTHTHTHTHTPPSMFCQSMSPTRPGAEGQLSLCRLHRHPALFFCRRRHMKLDALRDIINCREKPVRDLILTDPQNAIMQMQLEWGGAESQAEAVERFFLFFFYLFVSLRVLTSCCPWTPQAAYCRTEFTTSGGSSSQSSLRIKTIKQHHRSHLLKVVLGHHAAGRLITDVSYQVTSSARFVDINSFISGLLIEIAAENISYSPEAHV